MGQKSAMNSKQWLTDNSYRLHPSKHHLSLSQLTQQDAVKSSSNHFMSVKPTKCLLRQQKLEKVMDQEGLADEEVSDTCSSYTSNSREREFTLKRPEVTFTSCQVKSKINF